jgi:hypothetical protein
LRRSSFAALPTPHHSITPKNKTCSQLPILRKYVRLDHLKNSFGSSIRIIEEMLMSGLRASQMASPQKSRAARSDALMAG